MTSAGPDFSNLHPHSPLRGNAPPTPAVAPVIGDATAHTEPADAEEVYFEGSPPVRALSGLVAIWFLAAIVLIAIAILLMVKHAGPWWLKLALVVVGVALTFIPGLRARSIRYRITNYRIDYERGLLAKNIDTLELWHVDDIHFHQSLMDRIMNVGSITVVSHDETMPKLDMMGIPDPRPLYETLKQRVIAVKRQRGVIKMDPG